MGMRVKAPVFLRNEPTVKEEFKTIEQRLPHGIVEITVFLMPKKALKQVIQPKQRQYQMPINPIHLPKKPKPKMKP